MRKKSKLTLALAVCSVSAAFAGLALSNTTVQATEETPAAVFAMKKGAAVRAVANEAGIRWTTNVTETWVTDTNNIPTGATGVQFGTLVTSVNNVTEDGKIDVEKLTATTAEVQDLPCDVQPSYTNGTFTYYSAITYDNVSAWSNDDKNKAYATELIARSYVKYKASGSSDYTYKYATANDSARCMRAVALAAYEETDQDKALTPEEKDIVDDYFATGATTAVDFTGYYETANPETVATYSAAYLGAKKVGEVNEGALTLDSLTLGEKYTLTLFDTSGNYAKSSQFQYITRLLNQDNFAATINVSGTINGYYVLSSDIDLDGTYYGVSNTFEGTLDGNGHNISGISVTTSGKGGLFYALAGTVKNVSITGEIATKCNGGLIADNCAGGETVLVEDVYVDAKLNHKSTGAIVRAVFGGASVTINDVVVYRTDTSTSTGGGVLGQVSITSKKVDMKNCYYIAKTGRTPLNNATTTGQDYYTMVENNGEETVFGDKTENGGVTTYTKNDKVTLTAYYGTNAAAAKSAFDTAVATENVTLSDEVKAMMYPTNNG